MEASLVNHGSPSPDTGWEDACCKQLDWIWKLDQAACIWKGQYRNQLSILFLIHDINPTFIREHMLSLDFYTGGTKEWQERLEPLGTDPRTHCSCQVFIIHLWETGTLATRNGLSMREVPLAYFMSFYKNIFVRFWPHICWNCSRWGGVFLNLQRT